MYLTTVDITEVTAMTTADITISKISKQIDSVRRKLMCLAVKINTAQVCTYLSLCFVWRHCEL
jgi:hypothetical protein